MLLGRLIGMDTQACMTAYVSALYIFFPGSGCALFCMIYYPSSQAAGLFFGELEVVWKKQTIGVSWTLW